MKRRIHVTLLATLMCTASGWSQDVSVYSTSIAQVWKQDTPGFDKNTFAPATEFLGIDANKLGTDALSLHLYGWGTTDLGDQTGLRGKSDGNLTYGYMQYRFAQANAEVKAGRFAINQGGGFEQVDGVSARTDLIGGFAISAFGGVPVLFKPQDTLAQKDYDFQRNAIFGTRLSWRIPKMGELGVSYLQDGTSAAKNLPVPSPVDYTRKQLGADIKLSPISYVDFNGRTIFDIAQHSDLPAGSQANGSHIAEHDYNLSVKVIDLFTVTGAFTERNFRAYFAGTNLPSLFHQDEKGKFRAEGASMIWGSAAAVQVVADYRHTHREIYGDANRFGGEVRWTQSSLKLQSGFAYHKITTDDVPMVDPTDPSVRSYSLSHGEARAWVMYGGDKLFASLDGILQNYDDKHNANLYGKTSIYEIVGSLGINTTSNLKISGDIAYSTDPLFRKEVRGLVRAEYRFGTAGKGGRK